MPQLAQYHAVVFDMDGTLTPNMHLHGQAFAAFIQKHRLPTPDAVVEASLSGKRNSEIFPVLFGRSLPSHELDGPHYFKAITLGSEVTHGKPAPDIFVEAARRLGTAASQCIGIEDSFAGLQAVRAAGMYTVAIATTHTAAELAVAQPDVIVHDYHELLRHFEE